MPIRLATPADASALTALAGAFRDHLERKAPSDAQFLESIGRLLAEGDAEFLLATEEGEPVGYVLLRYRHSMWASGLEATLEDLFVDPALRGRGVGGRLVQSALARAEEKGCVTACLDTNEHNAASNRIYSELGFSAHSKRWNGRQIFHRRALSPQR
jgi:GNAT superfamily N-acetyltransferase